MLPCFYFGRWGNVHDPASGVDKTYAWISFVCGVLSYGIGFGTLVYVFGSAMTYEE